MTKAKLKQSPAPEDVANHAESKHALKALQWRVRRSRRMHYQAIVAIDAIFSEMKARLSTTPLHEKVEVISEFEDELEPFLWPISEAMTKP